MKAEAARILRSEYLQILLWSSLLRDGERVPGERARVLRERIKQMIEDCRRRLGGNANEPRFQEAEKAVVAAVDAAATRRFGDNGGWRHLQLDLFSSPDESPKLGTEVLERLRTLASYVPHDLPLEVLEIYERCIALGYSPGNLEQASEALRRAIAQRVAPAGTFSPALRTDLALPRRRFISPVFICLLAALVLALCSLSLRSAIEHKVAAANTDINQRIAESGCR